MTTTKPQTSGILHKDENLETYLDGISGDLTPLLSNGIIYHATFFESNEDTRIGLAISNNGTDFTNLTYLHMDDGTYVSGRDPSMVYYDGYWLIAVTRQTKYGQHDFTVFRSSDLKTWAPFACNMGDTPNFGKLLPGTEIPVGAQWAPELCIDKDGHLKCVVSFQVNNNETDINGNSIPSFRPYYCDLIDIEMMKWSDPVSVNMPTGNKIDADILWDGLHNRYIMAIKNEINKTCEIYTSSSFGGAYAFSSTVPFSQFNEGMSMAFDTTGTKLRVYTDFFNSKEGIVFSETTDLTTWTAEKYLQFYPARHGCVRKVDMVGVAIETLVTATATAPVVDYTQRLQLKDIGSGNITLAPSKDVMYALTGSNVVNLTLDKGGRRVRFALRTGQDVAGINFVNIVGGTYKFGFGRMKDRVIDLEWDTLNSGYRVVGREVQPAARTTLGAAGSTVNNFVPQHMRVYAVTGSAPVVLNSVVTNMEVGSKFYIQINTAAAGGVTLTGGGAGFGFSTTKAYVGSSGWDGCMLEMVLTTEGWAPTAKP